MAPRGRPPKPSLSERTLVIDNGADTIKAGFASADPSVVDCHIIPNCIAKQKSSSTVWVGAQLERCKDFGEMGFRRPVQKGFLTNWEAEKEIWDQTFFDDGAKLHCDPHDTNLILAEAPNGPLALATNCDQIIFEEFEFAAYRRCIGPSLNAWHNLPKLFNDPKSETGEAGPVECVIVVDCGYSHTTVTPLYKGRPIQQAMNRLEVGGKFLTNHLKDLISMRYFDISEETHMADEMKRKSCYVSLDFKGDMERVRRDRLGSGIVKDYVLPDYVHILNGDLRDHDPKIKKQVSVKGFHQREDGVQEHLVTLGIERFAVPEIIFKPIDIGMQQAGLAEVIMQSLAKVPTGLWSAMLANIVLVGGTAEMQGLKERLYAELRPLAPAECTHVRIAVTEDLRKSTWLGGARLASNREFLKEFLVTRQDYLEYGSAWLARTFAGEKSS